MNDLFRLLPAAVAARSTLFTALGPPFSTRLEPQSATGDPATGLQAQVWDPLWMLGRQWQLGEFVGEDTGTPLTVRIQASVEPLVAWHPGRTLAETDDWLPLDSGALLESLTDAEPVPSPSARDLAVAGWALVDSLNDLGQLAAARVLTERCPAQAHVHEPDPATAVVADTWAPVAASVLGRGIDARRVLAEFEGNATRPTWWTSAVTGGANRRRQTEQMLAHWLEWVRAEVAPLAPGRSSWLGTRLEYEFGVATPTAVLRAPSHPGGEAAWTSFDLVTDGNPPPSDAAPRTLDRTVLATPLSFPGMPASRFWELEDGRTDLGSVWADPHELARLLVIECALVYGGDWLVVPLDVPAGGVVTLDAITYTDTFGTTWAVDSAGANTPRWRMYTVTAAEEAEAHLPGLLVPPPSAGRLMGTAIEDVGFVRDEAANMVWAIEHLVPGPGGDPVVPRSHEVPVRPAPEPQGDEPVLDYQLMTAVPETWTSYLPRIGAVEEQSDRAVTLVRGVVRRYDHNGDESDVTPAGTLVPSDEHRAIESAEVPRQGVRVQRIPVVARRGDGSWAAWTSRRVLVGRGEGESGLRFDVAVRRRT